MTIVTKLVAAGACALMSSTALANSIPFESNGRTVEVSYQGLDLSKKADQRELTLRVRRAAVKVCPAPTVSASRACQLSALDNVRAPLAAAIASAQAREASRFAEVDKDKAPAAPR
ncbi:UrcA family protein [Sphingobium bisphenolivorans]|uniref:UrcA family protein n=1 Tax=Sphingobium bisphenolivorans TaxID=1335760 RepID=UPI0003A74008|nr:UrcA family protein [Sphingobium bisphenolivorans]